MHETGAVEATGHRCCPARRRTVGDGGRCGSRLALHTDEHMWRRGCSRQPADEIGTVYHLDELKVSRGLATGWD
ncbi:MAG: hypothetical protein ACLTV6_07470 [Christensenellales bacterium]